MWLRSWDLTYTSHPLGVVGSYQHGWLTVPRARRLGASEAARVQERSRVLPAWLRVAHTGWLDEVNLTAV